MNAGLAALETDPGCMLVEMYALVGTPDGCAWPVPSPGALTVPTAHFTFLRMLTRDH